MNDVATTLRSFVRDQLLFADDVPFSDHDSFLELGIIDSTGVLELVDFIQRRWGVTVEDDELVPENLDSVHNLVQFLRRKLGPSPAVSQGAS